MAPMSNSGPGNIQGTMVSFTHFIPARNYSQPTCAHQKIICRKTAQQAPNPGPELSSEPNSLGPNDIHHLDADL